MHYNFRLSLLSITLSYCLTPLYNSAYADAPIPIEISASNWESLTSESGSGYFYDLLKIIYPDHKYNKNVHMLPLRRSIQWVIKAKSNMIAGIYKSNGEIAVNYSKNPILVDSIDLITLKENNAYMSDVPHLRNKKIGSIIGMKFQNQLPEKTEYFEYKTHAAMLKMLHKGRIDALIGFASDIIPIAENLNIPIHIESSVLSINLYVGFSQTNHADKLKNTFDEKFLPLIRNGTVKKLIDSYQPGLNAGNYPFLIKDDNFVAIE